MHNPSLEHEAEYWGDCTNTYCEETKQFVYAELMNLNPQWYQVDVGGASILDIGGGPSSLLLKAFNLKLGLVIDPLLYPDWTIQRYKSKGILVSTSGGEDIKINNQSQVCVPDYETTFPKFDEVWIYNCLQHVVDPELILFNARRSARILRIAEWVDCPPDEMHPWVLHESILKRWIGTDLGDVTELNRDNCWGKMFHAVVPLS
jgi:hypothetical protein